MKTQTLTIISAFVLAIAISVYVFLLFQNESIRPQECQDNSTNCIYSLNMEVDNESRIYDGFPITTEVSKPVEFDGVKFVYTGSSTPEVDGINCNNMLPRAINSTSGHHPPIIVNYDGYFKINETRHFMATFPDGQVKSLTACWIGHTMPKVIQKCENLSCGGTFCPSKTSWFDNNKTAGIIQGERCSSNSPYYDKYVAEKQ